MTWAERTYVDYKRAQFVAALWHELGERAFDALFDEGAPVKEWPLP